MEHIRREQELENEKVLKRETGVSQPLSFSPVLAPPFAVTVSTVVVAIIVRVCHVHAGERKQ